MSTRAWKFTEIRRRYIANYDWTSDGNSKSGKWYSRQVVKLLWFVAEMNLLFKQQKIIFEVCHVELEDDS